MSVGESADLIMEVGIVAIVRLADVDAAEAAAYALAAGGARVIEFSLSSGAALEAIRRVRAADLDLMVGAGTVLTTEHAERAVEAGAEWLVSPHFPPQVLSWAQDRDILHVPGAFSPGDVAAARAAGAQLIKLFPARTLGPQYVGDLLGPFPDLNLVATGGIDESNARAFLAAGAVAVAVGGAFNDPDVITNPGRVVAAVRRLRAAIADPNRSSKETETCR